MAILPMSSYVKKILIQNVSKFCRSIHNSDRSFYRFLDLFIYLHRYLFRLAINSYFGCEDIYFQIFFFSQFKKNEGDNLSVT